MTWARHDDIIRRRGPQRQQFRMLLADPSQVSAEEKRRPAASRNIPIGTWHKLSTHLHSALNAPMVTFVEACFVRKSSMSWRVLRQRTVTETLTWALTMQVRNHCLSFPNVPTYLSKPETLYSVEFREAAHSWYADLGVRDQHSWCLKSRSPRRKVAKAYINKVGPI